MSITYAKGWFYRYDYQYPHSTCDYNILEQVTAYSLGKCTYDPTFASYVNVTCDNNYAYVKRYSSGICTGPSTTAFQQLTCEAAFGAYYGCTRNTDWSTFIPTNGIYGMKQSFTTQQNCDISNESTDFANNTMIYFVGQINGTCVPTYVDTSQKLLFPVQYSYSTTDNCASSPTTQTWPLTCTADGNGGYYKAVAVGKSTYFSSLS